MTVAPHAKGLLIGTFVLLAALGPVAADESAGVGDPEAEGPAVSAPGEEAAPKGNLVHTGWYLLAHRDQKIGYRNEALFRLEGTDSIRYRLEVRRFLKPSPDARRVGVFEQSVLEMDGNWSARSLKTSRRGLGVQELKVQGRVRNGKLAGTVAHGGESTPFSVPVVGNPTFDAAFLHWLADEPVELGRTRVRRTINEREASVGPTPRMVRLLQKSRADTSRGEKDIVVAAEQWGMRLTGLLLHSDARLYRAEGQNHDLTVQEIPAEQAASLELDGEVPWQSRIENLTGQAFSSSTFGYKLTLPPYPYVPVASEDGKALAAENVLEGNGIFLFARRMPPGPEGPFRKLYALWTRTVGEPEDVVETDMELDGIAARRFRGNATIGGRRARFELVAAGRGGLGYLVALVALWPEPDLGDERFNDVLESLSWTRIFGRERGHWNGPEYVSDSFGYRVQLLGPGWRLPEQRSGVATKIEAVREDRSAVLAVLLEAAEDGLTLEKAADETEARVKKNIPDAGPVRRGKTELDGAPAVVLTYEARAIDDEPTESRHVLALRHGQLYALTFVSKQASLEETEAHFDRAVQSFRFGTVSTGDADGE